MKRRLILSLILLSAFSAAAYGQEHSTKPPQPQSTPVPNLNQNNDGWVTFRSTDGKFNVLLPETPQEKTETTQSEHGPYTTHLFVVRSDPNVFLIGWVDYDPAFRFDPTLELEANRDNFVKGINGTLINNQNLRYDGYQTLEFTAETTERTFRSRVYMVGRRPYLLVSGTPKGVDDQFNVNRFFSSLKFRSQ